MEKKIREFGEKMENGKRNGRTVGKGKEGARRKGREGVNEGKERKEKVKFWR
jgi:hypothetical protein